MRHGGSALQGRESSEEALSTGAREEPWNPLASTRVLKNSLCPRLLKKVQMQGGVTHQMGTRYPSAGWVQVRGVLGPYVAAPRERANAANGPFSAAC